MVIIPIAMTFRELVKACGLNTDGRVDVPSRFLEAWKKKATITFPYGKSYIDPIEKWVFQDGSAVLIGNPSQKVLPMVVRVVDDQEKFYLMGEISLSVLQGGIK